MLKSWRFRAGSIVLCFYSTAVLTGAPPRAEKPELFAHPSGGETYLSTATIVVSGAIIEDDAVSLAVVVNLIRTRTNTIYDSGAANTKSAGQWAIRLTPPTPWPSDDYKIELVTGFGVKSSASIKIIDNPRFSRVRRPEIPQEDADEGKAIVSFDDVTIVNADVDTLKFLPETRRPVKASVSSKVTRLIAGSQFTLEGKIEVEDRPEHRIPPVVLQVVEVMKNKDQEATSVVVDEDFVHPEETNAGFQFQKILTTPTVPGRYTLRALYRRALLSEALINVEAAQEADKDNDRPK